MYSRQNNIISKCYKTKSAFVFAIKTKKKVQMYFFKIVELQLMVGKTSNKIKPNGNVHLKKTDLFLYFITK